MPWPVGFLWESIGNFLSYHDWCVLLYIDFPTQQRAKHAIAQRFPHYSKTIYTLNPNDFAFLWKTLRTLMVNMGLPQTISHWPPEMQHITFCFPFYHCPPLPLGLKSMCFLSTAYAGVLELRDPPLVGHITQARKFVLPVGLTHLSFQGTVLWEPGFPCMDQVFPRLLTFQKAKIQLEKVTCVPMGFFPSSLTALSLHDCSSPLTDLPPQLVVLTIGYQWYPASDFVFPDSLIRLTLRFAGSVDQPPFPFPSTLLALKVRTWVHKETIPCSTKEAFLPRLTHFTIGASVDVMPTWIMQLYENSYSFFPKLTNLRYAKSMVLPIKWYWLTRPLNGIQVEKFKIQCLQPTWLQDFPKVMQHVVHLSVDMEMAYWGTGTRIVDIDWSECPFLTHWRWYGSIHFEEVCRLRHWPPALHVWDLQPLRRKERIYPAKERDLWTRLTLPSSLRMLLLPNEIRIPLDIQNSRLEYLSYPHSRALDPCLVRQLPPTLLVYEHGFKEINPPSMDQRTWESRPFRNTTSFSLPFQAFFITVS